MNAITSFFLRAKHWQVFLVTSGLFFFGELVFIISVVPRAGSPRVLGKMGLVFGFVGMLMMSGFLGWLWSMGTFLASIVQPALRLKLGFFRFALIYPAVYGFFFTGVFENTDPSLVLAILPLHFLAMFCMFYLLYFVSKSLALAETGRPVSFYDYAGPFFLIWFFPIGIWIIQPRINRHYTERRITDLFPTPSTG